MVTCYCELTCCGCYFNALVFTVRASRLKVVTSANLSQGPTLSSRHSSHSDRGRQRGPFRTAKMSYHSQSHTESLDNSKILIVFDAVRPIIGVDE